MEWLGSDKAWPPHRRKEARAALSEAKARGWRFARLSDHAFGKIQCPSRHPACEVTIFSTGKGDQSGAATANIIRQRLRKCLNTDSGPEPLSIVELEATLVSAERLAVAAERRLESEHLRSRSDERLARAGDTADREIADRLFDEASAADERALAEDRAAWVDAQRFGLGKPWPPAEGAATLKRIAREQLDVVRSGLAAVDVSAEFRDRFDSLARHLVADGNDGGDAQSGGTARTC